MSKERIAQVLTVLILGAALAFTLYRKRTPRAEATPQDAIYRMLDAAREGDVKKYLAYYTGSMESALQRSIADSSEAAFRKNLQDTNAAVKGVAVMAPESVSDREVRVRVEFVYQDRNEAQNMLLEQTSDGWKIARVDTAEPVKSPVPYGTPVK